MTQAFKTKLMMAAFVPFALGASAAYATGDTKSPSANATNSTTATTPATSSSTTSNTQGNMGNSQGSMKSSTSSTTSDSMSTSAATFDRLDTNHDGKLSASEAAADPKVQGAWKKLDAGNKGSISKAEFQAHAADIK